MKRQRLPGLVVLLWLAGCSSTASVLHADGDAATPVDVASSADVPITPIDAPRVDVPAPELRCLANADCGTGRVCEYDRGCTGALGRCVDDGCQSLPVAPQYCGCNGETIQQASACRPDRAWSAEGACAARDAGASTAPEAVMAWSSPGGVAGWGPAVRVHGDGLVEAWDMVSSVGPDAASAPANRSMHLSVADVGALFDAWRATSLAGLPHHSVTQECYPTVATRLCATCAVQSIRYNIPSDLLPEMSAVWEWFDRVLPASNPRQYCDF